MAAVLYLVASGYSAWLATTRFSRPSTRVVRHLASMVLWAVLVIVPVHISAALQMAGWISATRLWPLAGTQLLILVLTALVSARSRRVNAHRDEETSAEVASLE